MAHPACYVLSRNRQKLQKPVKNCYNFDIYWNFAPVYKSQLALVKPELSNDEKTFTCNDCAGVEY